MAYDEGLAQRIEEALVEQPGLVAKKMFGGIGFMIHGNMAVGVHKDSMIIRVGPDNYEELLAEPFARVFDITGRAMRGWILVAAQGLDSEESLDFWTQKGVDFASSLPKKSKM